MKLSELPNPRRRARRPPRAARAFTVVELVGVLAVVAIIAAFMAENIIEKMRLAAIDAERTSLASLSKTLEKYVVRTKSIPALTNLPAALAADLAVAQDRVTHTAQGNPRWFWVDPECRVGNNALGVLSYTQSAADSTNQPQRLRLVVLSSVGTPLPTPAVSPDASKFLQAWNAVARSVPAFLSSSWNGRPDDLNIQRLELGTLFCRVVLENLDANYDAWYSVDETNNLARIPKLTNLVSNSSSFWLVRGTVLNFHYPDAAKTIQAREYIMEDVGYTFENGRWGRYLRYGPNLSNGWFGEMVDRFLAAPPPPGATRRYSTQQWVIDAMYQFLYCFGQWSLDYFYGGPPWPHIPGYEQANAGATGLADYSSDLLITN